ncbi:Hypothetical protein, putative [Bodo saltans]|uniref:Leucine-rich repeat protein n=1 Tax=Bodo saltans TaxID=75058 RepID=A0A0S4IST8_BODSA|nr:Hypothetical protein, putative [Bodo saltans]|eukprot:CUF73936.1 Hypothetical protein, putative [Bodo saltans]
MNSVEQARAKKKAAGLAFGAPAVVSTSANSNPVSATGSGSFSQQSRTKPIPSPPPPPAQRGVTPPGEEGGGSGSFLQRQHSSFGRKALPSIPQGAIHQSPKTRKVLEGSSHMSRGGSSSRGGGVGDDDDDDVDSILRRIDRDNANSSNGTGTPTDPMDVLDADEGGGVGDDDDDDVDAILRRIDRDNANSSNGTGTPTDPMDVLDADDYEAATQAFGRRITPEYLRNHTGVEDLHLVTSAEIVVDSRVTTAIDTIGEFMPRLVELRLSHSRIPIFRDLGTKFGELQVLYLNNAHLQELRGISVCRKLRELYLAFNLLEQISDLGALSELEVLDLEANRIQSISEIGFMSYQTSLKSLCIEGNPVCSSWDREVREDDAALSDVRQEDMNFRQYIAARFPHLERIDDVPVKQQHQSQYSNSSSSVSASARRGMYADPMTSDLMKELELVQSSVRQNVHMNGGLEGAIEGQNRSLYSRQSTSCSGARRRTPASQSTPRSTAAAKMDVLNRSHVNSAPTETSMSSPHKQQSATFLAPAAAAVAAVNPLDRRSNLSGAATTTNSGNASLLTSGAAISGSLAKSLRRRLPTLPIPAGSTSASKSAVPLISDEALARLRNGGGGDAVGDGAPSSPRTLREHELVEHINRMKACRIAGEAEKEAEAMASVHKLLDELGLEMDFECAMGDDDDGLEQLRKGELERLLLEERPKFLEAYRDQIQTSRERGDSSDDDTTENKFGNNKLTDEELIREVARLKQRTLRDMATGLMEDPQKFESLQMDDLGGDEEGVL